MSYLADYQHPEAVRSLLESLVPIVCPPLATELGLQAAIVAHVELSMRASSSSVRAALLMGMAGYELAALAFPSHRGRRASQLGPEAGARYFASWYHSRLLPRHEFAKGLKGLLCLGCYEQPAAMEAIGYRPERWVEQRRSYRLQTYDAAIRAREDAILAPDPLPGVPENRREVLS